MKRIFITLCLCMSVMLLSAQPWGRSNRNRMPGQPQSGGFKELLSYGVTNINAKSICQMLTINPTFKMTEKEIALYGHDQLLDDMYELFLPVYRQSLSHADINFILSAYHSLDIRMATRHLAILDEISAEDQGKYISPAINTIISGETPAPTKLNEGIPQSFLQACGAYYKATGRPEMLSHLKNATGQMADNDGAKRMAKIVDYLIANTPTIYANIAFEKVTEDELTLMTTYLDTPAFKHLQAGNMNLSSKSQEIFPKLIEKAQQWKAKRPESNN